MLNTLLSWAPMMVAFLAVSGIAIAVLPRWKTHAERRGGRWYLEAQLWINGPMIMLCIFFYGPEGPTQPWSTIARALSIASIAIAIATLYVALKEPRKGSGKYIAVIAAYYLALIFSGFVGATPALPEPYWTTPLIIISFLAHGGYTREWLTTVATWVLRCILLLSILTMLLPDGVAFNTTESRTVFGISRLEGIASHPNALGAFGVIGLLFELFRKPCSWLWVLVSAATVVLAQSNTAWLALAVALLFLPHKFGVLYRGAGIAVLVVAALLTIFKPQFEARVDSFLFNQSTVSLNGRTRIWEAALAEFEKYPIFGYGPTLLNEQYRHRYLGEFNAAAQAHNQWVQDLGGAGIIGIVALSVMILLFLSGSIKSWKAGIGLPVALMVAIIVRGISETPFRPTGPSEHTFLFIVVLATVVLSASMEKDKSTQSRNKRFKRLPREVAQEIL